MIPALEVLETGPLVLIEDEGRPGHASVGVGHSGAADRSAHRLGARLVGNDEHLASLEVLLVGLRVRARGRLTVALTGVPAGSYVVRAEIDGASSLPTMGPQGFDGPVADLGP